MTPEPRGWSLAYEDYRPAQEGLREALCTLGNGYFATRGAAPDSSADDVHYPGTYLAGGYNRLVSEIAGRKVENEDLVNMPNWLPLTFRVDDGAWFRIDDVQILSFRQWLDLRRGVLYRDLRFRDAEGRTTRWRERRMVSMADPHLASLSVELTAEDWAGRLTIRSGLDASVVNSGVARYRDLASRHLDILELDHLGADTLVLRCQNQSRIQVALAARTRLYREGREIDADVQGGTTPEGIHVGAMAGTIDLIQRCYIGIEMWGNALHIDPALPDDVRHIKVRVRYRRQMLDLDVDHDTLRIGSRSLTVAPITVAYRGHYRDLAAGETCQFQLLKPDDRDRDENPVMKAAQEANR